MRYMKIGVTKTINNGAVDWSYPQGYNRDKIMPVRYQHQGGQVQHYDDEFLLGIADDSFPTNGTDLLELTQAEYEAELAALPTPAA